MNTPETLQPSDWSGKDRDALLAMEANAGAPGLEGNNIAFRDESYAGPAWNIFASAWKWFRAKVGKK